MSGRGDISLVLSSLWKGEKGESDPCTANSLSLSIEKELAPFPILANSCNQWPNGECVMGLFSPDMGSPKSCIILFHLVWFSSNDGSIIKTVEFGSLDRKPLAIEIEASKDCSSLLTKTLCTVGSSLWLDIS